MQSKETEDILHLLDHYFSSFYNNSFIADDPISIPHLFQQKEDIEIAGFLAATIAWGQRKSILRSAHKMLDIMNHAPYDFVLNHEEKDLVRTKGFVHRTFNLDDLIYFFHALKNIYKNEGGLEMAMTKAESVKESLHLFKQCFFQLEHLKRTEKHVADPLKGSSAKRLNMYLRWMVRPADQGVDFGIWSRLNSKDLMMPLDVHTATVGRKLGLLTRKQNDWKAVEELTSNLRKFDANDPTKYDFALFGIGVNQVEI